MRTFYPLSVLFQKSGTLVLISLRAGVKKNEIREIFDSITKIRDRLSAQSS